MSWMDELMTDASKTLMIGVGAEGKKVCDLNMKRGKCPHCGAEIERTAFDKFFPYCCHEHKRVLEREEEAKLKAEIAAEEERERKRYERHLESNARCKRKARAMSKRTVLEAKLKNAQEKWDENTKKAINAPKGSAERRRANVRAREWYLTLIKTQKELKELDVHDNEASVVQGHGSGRTDQDAGNGHDQ